MKIPLGELGTAGKGDLEQELNGTRTVIGVNKHNLASIDDKGLSEWKGNDEERIDAEDLCEETGGGGGAEHEALRPTGRETAVVIRVEVREEVRDGVIAGVAESVDGETGSGNEFGVGECGGKWRERELRWGRVWV